MAIRTGMSRNSVAAVRSRLVSLGWLIYEQEGRFAGKYTPILPHWVAQNSAMDEYGEAQNSASIAQNSAMDCATDALNCATIALNCASRGDIYPYPINPNSPSPVLPKGKTAEGKNAVKETRLQIPIPEKQNQGHDSNESIAHGILQVYAGKLRWSRKDGQDGMRQAVADIAACLDIAGRQEVQAAIDRAFAEIGSKVWTDRLAEYITKPAQVRDEEYLG